MPDNEFAGGPAGPEEPGKGRQQVRRHWKPSLGRFIHRYVRKGEHARPGPQGDGGAGSGHGELDAQESFAAPGRGRSARRLLVAGGALAVSAAIVTWWLIGRQQQAIAYEVLAAREPFMVRIDCGPATGVVLGGAQAQDKCVNEAVRSVLEAGRTHPDRLIVIDLKSPPISFTSLLPSDQKELRRALGASAGLRYESSVAGLLERIMDSAAGGGRVSVLGLPVERREVGIDASGRTNGCYGAVLDRIDCLVSAHVFYRGDVSISEEQLVQQTLIEALRSRAGRPVVFRQGTGWRVLVDRGTPRPEQQAARRLVLAEAGD